MLLSKKLLIFALTTPALSGNLVGRVDRRITGEFVDEFLPRAKRDGDSLSEASIRPLAAMSGYLAGLGGNRKDPESHKKFDKYLEKFTDSYTNYGCHCWINGAEKPFVGIGKASDETDKACQNLQRCYKCLNADYGNDLITKYNVAFKYKLSTKTRYLDCSKNDPMSEHLCLCDKQFAEQINQIEEKCDSGDDSVCPQDKFITISGGGSFDPNGNKNACARPPLMRSGVKAETQCCGIYPNRIPFESSNKECCRNTVFNGEGIQMEIFGIVVVHECHNMDGVAVKSKPGEPYNYITL